MTVEFEVVDGRVHHSGLALLLPHGEDSIEIVFSGSVGLDETLDLNLAVKLPEGLMGKGVVRDALTREPVQFAVGGHLNRQNSNWQGSMGFCNPLEICLSPQERQQAIPPQGMWAMRSQMSLATF